MLSEPTRLDVPPPFELWRVSLAPADGSALALLDANERARADRFHFERDRSRYVAAHAALRRLLAQRTGRDAASIAIETGAFGKPFLEGAPGCAFSLSHCEDVALVALSDSGEIGVDLERVRVLPDLDGLERQCLTVGERRQLDGLAHADRAHAFLRLWTRKEACLKALGTGLQVDPATFAVGDVRGPKNVCVLTISGPRDVLVTDVDVGPGWVGALARTITRH